MHLQIYSNREDQIYLTHRNKIRGTESHRFKESCKQARQVDFNQRYLYDYFAYLVMSPLLDVLEEAKKLNFF